MKLRIDELECTAATQVRVKLSPDVIDQYADDLKHGADMPAIVAWAEKGSERRIVSDGFHRIHAHVNAGIEEIEVDVREGGMHEALLHALGANDTHGLRRTRADRRNAVMIALKDPEISQLTQREIGMICGVTGRTVRNIQTDLAAEEDRKISASEEPENDPHDQGSEENKPENERESRPEPTQPEVELGEIRQACALIKALPYGGGDLGRVGKVELSKDDLADLEYVSTWCAGAVIACRPSPRGVGSGPLGQSL